MRLLLRLILAAIAGLIVWVVVGTLVSTAAFVIDPHFTGVLKNTNWNVITYSSATVSGVLCFLVAMRLTRRRRR